MLPNQYMFLDTFFCVQVEVTSERTHLFLMRIGSWLGSLRHVVIQHINFQEKIKSYLFVPYYNSKRLSVLQLWILNRMDYHLLQVCPHLASLVDNPPLVYLLGLIRRVTVLRLGIKSELLCILIEVHLNLSPCHYHMPLLPLCFIKWN